MKKMILALVAVLAIAGTSFADFSFDVQKTATYVGTTGSLDVWTLSINPVGTGPKVFQNMLITGVHQANDVVRGKATPTVFTNDFFDAAELADYGKYDTHLLFPSNNVVGTYVATETNNQGNPAGLPAYDYLDYGIGEFRVNEAFSFGSALGSGFAFMQVVLPSDTQVTMQYMADVGGAMATRSQLIGVVPEPSTVLLLFAGIACLLVARFRK